MSVEDVRCDMRLAWRGLARAKAFSVATILTLALGIAGTTVMFTLVRGVLLRPLPVREQERLIVAWKERRSSGFTHHPFGDLEIEAVGRESRLIEAVAGVDANGAGRAVVTENETSSYLNVAIVTGRFFVARERIRRVDPNVQVVQVSPYTRVLDRPLARPRFNPVLLGAFSTAALLLSAIGLYAVMSAFVRQRDREIAVRLALGATSAHVRGLVLGETARLAGLGALTGLAIAVVATRTIGGAFHDVVSLDPLMLLAAAAVLIAASMLVSLVPMRRAVRVDAVAVLRQ